jgi:hypothetical protein
LEPEATMNGINQADGLVFHVRRVICLMLTAGLVVLTGLPITLATADTVPLMREVSQSRPYVDCSAAPARIEELTGRLAERGKAIEKTKSMLPGLHDGSREAWAKADQIMSEAPTNLMTSFAGDYLKTTSSIKNRIKAMRKSGASKEQIELWLKSMKGLEDAGSFLKKAPASFEAGTKFGLGHQVEMTNLQPEFARTNELFVNSGLAEELGGEFATAIGGPLGKLAYDAGLTSATLIVTTEEAFIEAGAARRVQSAVDAMEWGYSRDYSEMVNLAALQSENCNLPKEKVAQSDNVPEPPPPSVAEEAPVTTTPAATAAGPNVGAMILVGGAAVAGAAALAVGLSTAAGTGADCGSAPQGFGSAWWADYSSWCRCMGGTPVVSTTQCVQ